MPEPDSSNDTPRCGVLGISEAPSGDLSLAAQRPSAKVRKRPQAVGAATRTSLQEFTQNVHQALIPGAYADVDP